MSVFHFSKSERLFHQIRTVSHQILKKPTPSKNITKLPHAVWYWRLSSSDDETNKKENNTLSALNLILIWHSYSFTFILFFFLLARWAWVSQLQRLTTSKNIWNPFFKLIFFMEHQLCFSIKCFWVHCSGEAIYLCPCQNLPECLFQSFALNGWTDETCCWVSHLQILFSV